MPSKGGANRWNNPGAARHKPAPPKRNPGAINQGIHKAKSDPGAAAANQRAEKAGPNRNRNYDKPWLVPDAGKKKSAPETFLEHHYPDGVGPDTDLI